MLASPSEDALGHGESSEPDGLMLRLPTSLLIFCHWKFSLTKLAPRDFMPAKQFCSRIYIDQQLGLKRQHFALNSYLLSLYFHSTTETIRARKSHLSPDLNEDYSKGSLGQFFASGLFITGMRIRLSSLTVYTTGSKSP